MNAKDDLKHLLMTGGATYEPEAEEAVQAALQEAIKAYAEERTVQARSRARKAVFEKVGGLFPGATAMNFADEIADHVVKAVFEVEEDAEGGSPTTVKVGEIYVHTERTDGVYACVRDVSKTRVLFSVWEVERPGWQGGAELGLDDFASIYRDGPYPAAYVLGATMEHVKDLLGVSGATDS